MTENFGYNRKESLNLFEGNFSVCSLDQNKDLFSENEADSTQDYGLENLDLSVIAFEQNLFFPEI